MTAEEMRQRVLALIKEWLDTPKVQADANCVNLLDALAGDVEVIDLG